MASLARLLLRNCEVGMRSSHGHRAHCCRHALLPLLGSALVSQRSASQVPHASPTMRFAIEAKTASTVLTWGTTDVLVGADQIRGVYIGTVAQTAKLGRSCASGARYDPSAIRSWLPSADSLLRAAGPDSADSRPSIQTLFLPNRAGGGVMLGRLRKGARQWDPSPILYFMDAQGR